MSTDILVVDDEAAIADLVEICLKNEGYTVHKFYTGKEALSCVESTHLDLAILDVMLPDVDGFTLCQKIREDHLFPILMLTAKVEDMDKIMGLTLGADDYLTKPFNPLELVARVKTQLRRYTRYNPLRGVIPRSMTSGGFKFPNQPTSASSLGRSSPSPRWSSPSSGTCVSTGGRWCPARPSLRRCGGSGTLRATTP